MITAANLTTEQIVEVKNEVFRSADRDGKITPAMRTLADACAVAMGTWDSDAKTAARQRIADHLNAASGPISQAEHIRRLIVGDTKMVVDVTPTPTGAEYAIKFATADGAIAAAALIDAALAAYDHDDTAPCALPDGSYMLQFAVRWTQAASCDECDPSFGCFTKPATCSKRLIGVAPQDFGDPVDVTAETVTDEQIEALRENGFYPADLVNYVWAALGSGPLTDPGFDSWRNISKAAGRARCAAAINARAKGGR